MSRAFLYLLTFSSIVHLGITESHLFLSLLNHARSGQKSCDCINSEFFVKGVVTSSSISLQLVVIVYAVLLMFSCHFFHFSMRAVLLCCQMARRTVVRSIQEKTWRIFRRKRSISFKNPQHNAEYSVSLIPPKIHCLL